MSDLMLKGKKEQDSKVAAKTEKAEIAPMLGKQPLMRETAVDFDNITPAQINHLQRTIGNQAVRRAVQRAVIQRKMTVGPVGDKYEQEADAVAKQVVSKINNPQPETVQRQEEEEELQMMPISSVQRQEEEEELQMMPISPIQRQEEEEELQMMPISPVQRQEEEEELQMMPISSVQRQEEEEELQMMPISPVQRQEEEEELQMKPSSTMDGGELASDVEGQIQSAKGGGRPLASDTQSQMGQAFNADFSGVKVHTDSQSDTLNRSISARAFTTGKDIFFRQGEYNPDNSGGQELLAHELTHVVQQNGGAVQRNVSSSSQTIQAKYVNAKVNWGGRTTFRSGQLPVGREGYGVYGGYVPEDNKTGNSIGRGSKILVDDSASKTMPNDPTDEPYRPAININIKNNNRDIPNQKIGWVKEAKVTYPQTPTIADALKTKLSTILKAVPRYGRLLNTPETKESLLKGAVRYEGGNNNWGSTQREMFARSLMLTESTVFPKVAEGAIFTGEMLDYWKNQLGGNVRITRLKLTESDLHEHGLGVVFTTFRKRGNRTSDLWQKFAGDANEFEVVLKPEDKSLERALIGSQEDSVANQINDEAGLTEDQKLTTIKMESTETHGSMIEKIDGESMAQKAKSLPMGQFLTETEDISPAFYETMSFAFIAGIGDLHKENVMYGTDDNKPYLIDADNVIEHDQMEKQNFGENTQTGFGQKNRVEASEHQTAMKDMDHTYDKSVLFTKLIEDNVVRGRIFNLIRASLAGKSARVVPVGTGTWASQVNIYKGEDALARTARINNCAQEEYIVRGNNKAVGAGLIGNCNVGDGGGNYDQAEERTQLRQDFNGGIIPFYNYDFDSGEVTHNGQRIYTGQTVEEAIDRMEDKFLDASIAQWMEGFDID